MKKIETKKMRSWEEMTKLETRTKIMIIFHVIMVIFSIVTAIVNKNFTWIVCALLWADVAIIEYCDAKLMKGKDALIEIQEEHIKVQDNMINDLLERINKKSRIIKLVDIKIPEHFTKPNKNKLKRRTEYFVKNKCFATPIIINRKTLMLVDGYTSYLIAKKYNLENVEVEEE